MNKKKQQLELNNAEKAAQQNSSATTSTTTNSGGTTKCSEKYSEAKSNTSTVKEVSKSMKAQIIKNYMLQQQLIVMKAQHQGLQRLAIISKRIQI